ncbi:VENN motif pre-toxin domain-containing protein [Moraxella nonliquefaciens]|nr:VENN motif pre-toxin domain-containing protein [Moraxella nonliquefaciens]
MAAPALANYLYGTNEPSELNQEQKDTIVSILNLATVTTAYTATDGNTTDAMSASEIGKVGWSGIGLALHKNSNTKLSSMHYGLKLPVIEKNILRVLRRLGREMRWLLIYFSYLWVLGLN